MWQRMFCVSVMRAVWRPELYSSRLHTARITLQFLNYFSGVPPQLSVKICLEALIQSMTHVVRSPCL